MFQSQIPCSDHNCNGCLLCVSVLAILKFKMDGKWMVFSWTYWCLIKFNVILGSIAKHLPYCLYESCIPLPLQQSQHVIFETYEFQIKIQDPIFVQSSHISNIVFCFQNYCAVYFLVFLCLATQGCMPEQSETSVKTPILPSLIL